MTSEMVETSLDDTTNAAADAIEDAVRKSTLGIVVGSGKQKWTGIGTGTLVRWRGQLLILTADHVLGTTALDDLRFFLPNETPPATIDREALLRLKGLPAAGLRPFRDLHVSTIQRDATLDLAAINLSESDVSNISAVAFDMLDEDREATPGLTSLVIGFPHDISRILQDDSRVVFTQIDWSPVEVARPDFPGFDPAVHFLTQYTPPQWASDANPRGLSGAARWARRGSTPGVWFPNLDVIGVTVTYYPVNRLLKMVRRSVVNRFLRECITA